MNPRGDASLGEILRLVALRFRGLGWALEDYEDVCLECGQPARGIDQSLIAEHRLEEQGMHPSGARLLLDHSHFHDPQPGLPSQRAQSPRGVRPVQRWPGARGPHCRVPAIGWLAPSGPPGQHPGRGCHVVKQNRRPGHVPSARASTRATSRGGRPAPPQAPARSWRRTDPRCRPGAAALARALRGAKVRLPIFQYFLRNVNPCDRAKRGEEP